MTPPLCRTGRYDLCGTFADVWLASRHDLLRTGGVLGVEDRERLAGMEIAQAREEFTASRLALRAVLSHYPVSAAGSPCLVRDANGRPQLAGEPDWDVNLSHAGSLVAVAVGHRIRLGVDIERVVPLESAGLLARRYFSAGERAQLAALGPSRSASLHLWYQIWTRKEAYAKAYGVGVLSISDQRIVGGGAGEHVVLAMPADYVGTLAALSPQS